MVIVVNLTRDFPTNIRLGNSSQPFWAPPKPNLYKSNWRASTPFNLCLSVSWGVGLFIYLLKVLQHIVQRYGQNILNCSNSMWFHSYYRSLRLLAVLLKSDSNMLFKKNRCWNIFQLFWIYLLGDYCHLLQYMLRPEGEQEGVFFYIITCPYWWSFLPIHKNSNIESKFSSPTSHRILRHQSNDNMIICIYFSTLSPHLLRAFLNLPPCHFCAWGTSPSPQLW